jgi:hypothetical protein
MEVEIEESEFIEYYLLGMPEYYPNVEYLERLESVGPDIRAKFVTILKQREDGEGRLFTSDEVYRVDDRGKIVEKRPKYRYVCIVPLDDGTRARALTMFEGDNTAQGVSSGGDRARGIPSGTFVMPLAKIQSHLAQGWPDAHFLTKEQMLGAQGPCVRCKQPKYRLTSDLCEGCDALLKSMVNEGWSDDAYALFKEFTIPEFKRGGIIPVTSPKAS